MDLRETIEIDAPADAVWPLLRDPHAVAACFPGAELRGTDGRAHDGRITVRFGPTAVSFQGRAEITPDDGTRTVTISARGRDSRGATRASAEVVVQVHEEGADRTRVAMSGDVDVGGPLAQFARTGGVAVTRQLLRDFGACVTARATAATAGPAAPPPAPTPARPPRGTAILWRALVEWCRERVGRRRVR